MYHRNGENIEEMYDENIGEAEAKWRIYRKALHYLCNFSVNLKLSNNNNNKNLHKKKLKGVVCRINLFKSEKYSTHINSKKIKTPSQYR